MAEFNVIPPAGVIPSSAEKGGDTWKAIEEYLRKYRPSNIDHTQLIEGGVRVQNLQKDARYATAVVSTDMAGGNFGPTQIQNAIDYVNSLGGGTVLIKEGTFALPAGLTGYSNIHLIGSGERTILDAAALTTDVLTFSGTIVSDTGTIAISTGGTTVTGTLTTFQNDGVAAGDIILLAGIPYIVNTITSNTSLTITKTYLGADLSGQPVSVWQPVSNVLISNLKIINVPANKIGVLLSYFSNAIIDRVIIDTSDGSASDNDEGIELGIGFGGRIKDCVTRHIDGFGIYVFSAFGVKVEGCTSYGNKKHGIIVDASTECEVIHNDCHQNAEEGIRVQLSDLCLVSQNNCWFNDVAGINILASQYVDVSDNSISDNSLYGIHLVDNNADENLVWVKVSGNILVDNCSDSIADQGNILLNGTGGADTDINDISIKGNKISSGGGSGIVVTETASASLYNLEISGNAISKVVKNGIHVTLGQGTYEWAVKVEGNIISESNRASAAAAYYGIFVSVTGGSQVTICNNSIYHYGDGASIYLDSNIGSNPAIVNGNHIGVLGAGDVGIDISGNTNFSIVSANVVNGAGSATTIGIRVNSGATSNILSSNSIIGCVTNISDSGTGTGYFSNDTIPVAAGANPAGYIRKVISVQNIADNTATAIFTITTTNEAGSLDAGIYSCTFRGVVGHAVTAGSGTLAAKSFSATFARVVDGSGAGYASSTVLEIGESASAADVAATRDIGAVTMTVVNDSAYQSTIKITIDLTGTAVALGYISGLVELNYLGFLTPPVINAI